MNFTGHQQNHETPNESAACIFAISVAPSVAPIFLQEAVINEFYRNLEGINDFSKYFLYFRDRSHLTRRKSSCVTASSLALLFEGEYPLSCLEEGGITCPVQRVPLFCRGGTPCHAWGLTSLSYLGGTPCNDGGVPLSCPGRVTTPALDRTWNRTLDRSSGRTRGHPLPPWARLGTGLGVTRPPPHPPTPTPERTWD